MNLVLVPSVEKLAFGPIHILPSVETYGRALDVVVLDELPKVNVPELIYKTVLAATCKTPSLCN
jgi:hypothetical protein